MIWQNELYANKISPKRGWRGQRGGGGWVKAGLGRVNPVFQRQVFNVGEVPGVARNEGEAVGQGRATDEHIEFALQAADALEVRFLQSVGFQGAFERQDAPAE